MQYWPLRAGSVEHSLNLGHAANLFARVGGNRSRTLAADLLQLIGPGVPLAQCTIFAYAPRRNPQVFSFADRARDVALPRISHNYAERFYSQDGNQQAMARRGPAERILVQRQGIDDIAHPEYRRVCYEQPRISERVALLAHGENERWLSLNLYRGHEHGYFCAREMDYLETLAPLLMQAVRLHYQAWLQANELPLLLAERIAARQPGLTLREQTLLRLMLTGADNDTIAAQLGVRPSSAATYVKRLYRKLGIGGLRELIGLATQAQWA